MLEGEELGVDGHVVPVKLLHLCFCILLVCGEGGGGWLIALSWGRVCVHMVAAFSGTRTMTSAASDDAPMLYLVATTPHLSHAVQLVGLGHRAQQRGGHEVGEEEVVLGVLGRGQLLGQEGGVGLCGLGLRGLEGMRWEVGGAQAHEDAHTRRVSCIKTFTAAGLTQTSQHIHAPVGRKKQTARRCIMGSWWEAAASSFSTRYTSRSRMVVC